MFLNQYDFNVLGDGVRMQCREYLTGWFLSYILFFLSMYTMIGILLACSSSDQWRLVNYPVDVDDKGSNMLYEDIFLNMFSLYSPL